MLSDRIQFVVEMRQNMGGTTAHIGLVTEVY